MQVQANNVYASMVRYQHVEEPQAEIVADVQTDAAALDPTKLKDKKLDGNNAEVCGETPAVAADVCANNVCAADLSEVALKA